MLNENSIFNPFDVVLSVLRLGVFMPSRCSVLIHPEKVALQDRDSGISIGQTEPKQSPKASIRAWYPAWQTFSAVAMVFTPKELAASYSTTALALPFSKLVQDECVVICLSSPLLATL